MSTILDALRKSEAERLAGAGGQRTAGPVQPSPGRRRFALLAVAVTGLALGALLTQALLSPPPAIVIQPEIATESAPQRATATEEPTGDASSAAPMTDQPTTAAAAPTSVSDPREPNERASVTASFPDQTPVAAQEPRPAAAARSQPATPTGVPQPARQQSEPARPAPAEANQATTTPPPPRPRERLPTYQQLPDLHQTLGELSLTMLVYASDPARRFALINGERLRNGDALANGAVLSEIRRDSCVIEYAGRRFLLTSAP